MLFDLTFILCSVFYANEITQFMLIIEFRRVNDWWKMFYVEMTEDSESSALYTGI